MKKHVLLAAALCMTAVMATACGSKHTQTQETTEETTTENVITTRATLIVSPKASSTSRPVPETEIWAETDEVRTGDSMALGIVVTLLVASAGGVLLFAVLHEHKKK